MVPLNIGLAVAVPLRDIAAQVSAGHLPNDPVPNVGDQGRVFDDQIGDGEFPAAPDILDVAFGIKAVIFRPDALRGMAGGYVLGLKAGQGGGAEHIVRAAIDGDLPVRVALQPQLPRQVNLLSNPIDWHVPADQKALRGQVHVGADLRPVVCNHENHTLQNKKRGQLMGTPTS